jgi:hypothetical protein
MFFHLYHNYVCFEHLIGTIYSQYGADTGVNKTVQNQLSLGLLFQSSSGINELTG